MLPCRRRFATGNLPRRQLPPFARRIGADCWSALQVDHTRARHRLRSSLQQYTNRARNRQIGGSQRDIQISNGLIDAPVPHATVRTRACACEVTARQTHESRSVLGSQWMSHLESGVGPTPPHSLIKPSRGVSCPHPPWLCALAARQKKRQPNGASAQNLGSPQA